MSAAHTPGPWRTNLQAFPVEEGGDDELEISIEGSNPYQRTIAATFKTDGFTALNDDEIVGCSLEEAKANARLIAAAPELLEIARSVEGMVSNCDVSSGICCCGDSMENHADPMHCGHTPTDSGVHAASSLLKKARAAIAKATGETK